MGMLSYTSTTCVDDLPVGILRTPECLQLLNELAFDSRGLSMKRILSLSDALPGLFTNIQDGSSNPFASCMKKHDYVKMDALQRRCSSEPRIQLVFREQHSSGAPEPTIFMQSHAQKRACENAGAILQPTSLEIVADLQQDEFATEARKQVFNALTSGQSSSSSSSSLSASSSCLPTASLNGLCSNLMRQTFSTEPLPARGSKPMSGRAINELEMHAILAMQGFIRSSQDELDSYKKSIHLLKPCTLTTLECAVNDDGQEQQRIFGDLCHQQVSALQYLLTMARCMLSLRVLVRVSAPQEIPHHPLPEGTIAGGRLSSHSTTTLLPQHAVAIRVFVGTFTFSSTNTCHSDPSTDKCRCCPSMQEGCRQRRSCSIRHKRRWEREGGRRTLFHLF